MRLFRFADPQDPSYASASRRGTWVPSAGTVCAVCGTPQQRRVQPLVLEWEAGSALVGHFVWPGLDDDVVVADPIAREMQARFAGFELGPVEMRENAKPGKGPRVTLPYFGPELHDLYVERFVPLDLRRSTVSLTRHCRLCGARQYEVSGTERRVRRLDHTRGKLATVHSARVADQGIFIEAREIRSDDVFRVQEFPAWVFCTERVRDFLIGARATNVAFLEMGEVSGSDSS